MNIKKIYELTQNLNVLYVEDDQKEAEETKALLDDFFQSVYVKLNGLEGLNFYKKFNRDTNSFIDIVITDIKMPIMDGHEMIIKIKELNPNQHIIVLSAYGDLKNLINLFQNGIDDFIIKPILSKNLNIALLNCAKKIQKDKEYIFQQTLLEEIITFQENLLVVLDEKQNIIFSNKKFLDFFSLDSLEEFHEKYKRLAYLFIEDKEFFVPKVTGDKEWIDNIQSLDDNKRVVSLIDVNNISPKAFLINVNQIKTSGHSIVSFSEVTNMTIEKKILKEKAFSDELTGIYNRAYFNEVVKQEFSSFHRDNSVFSLIIFDIDYFKKFNDTYGHQTGDIILQELTQLVEKKTRQADLFARLGGEEFIKILHNTKLYTAINVAEHLREVIENHSFNNQLNVTCSFGVSEISKDDSIDDLIKKADDALYKAKRDGRNRVEWK